MHVKCRTTHFILTSSNVWQCTMSWNVSGDIDYAGSLLSRQQYNVALLVSCLTPTPTPRMKALVHGFPYLAPLTPFPSLKLCQAPRKEKRKKRTGRCDLWFGNLVPLFSNAENLWSLRRFPWFGKVYSVLWQRLWVRGILTNSVGISFV